MKRSDWIALIIVLVLIAGIAIGVYVSGYNKLEKFDGDAAEQKESKLAAISRRIQELQDRADKELKALNISEEKEAALMRKVDMMCVAFGSITMAILLSIVAAFYFNGMDLLNSVLCTAGLAALTFPVISIICWKNIGLEKTIDVSRAWAKKWLDKKYGHCSKDIDQLRQSITVKNEEIKLLTSEVSNSQPL